MRVIIVPDYQAISQWAANYVAGKINAANPTPEKPFILGCPTGSSPLGMYKALIELYKEGKVSFENVVTFNMDEYVGLPEDHPESYHSFMWNNFFSHINIKKENVHILNGNAEDLNAECAAYEAAMGPANFSFNLGNMHFLMLDNMMSQKGAYSDECATGLTDSIWEWVKNDLKHVSLDTPLMVCAHSPMMRTESGSDRSGAHLGELRNLLSKYKKAYVWAGHTHSTFNYVDKNDPVIETHTVSRVTGALWTNEYLGSNGTPRGYVAFEYDNGNISWKFKPLYYQTSEYGGYMNVGDPDYTWRDWDYDASGKAVLKSNGKPLDDTYQMQVFPPKTYGDNYLYVNIFLWDELWSTPRFTIDGSPAVMKRVTEKDYCYSYSDWFITSFYNTNTKYSSEFVPGKNNCSSMFRVHVDKEHGSGTVTVKDRFGNEHKSSITW